MSRITEMLLEPQTVYEGNTFTVKIKVRDDYKYKKYIVSENIKYTTIQGSSFTLTNVNGSQPGSILEIVGKSIQNGTPTPDAPIEIQSVSGDNNITVSNKNLFDIYNTIDRPSWNKKICDRIITDSNNFTLKSNATDDWCGIYTENLDSSKEYTIKFTATLLEGVEGNSLYVGTADVNSPRTAIYTNTPKEIVYTFTNSNRIYIKIVSQTRVRFSNIELVIGNTAGYIQHAGNSYRVDLGGENLIQNNMANQTINGITFTINKDKSIKVEGTATARTEPNLWTNANWKMKAGTNYYNNSNTTIYLYGSYNGANGYFIFNAGATYNRAYDYIVQRVYIRVENGATVNTTYYPYIGLKKSENYSPYVAEPIELNKIGEFQDTIKQSTGRNILGIEKLIRGGVYEYYQFKSIDDNSYYTLSIKLKAGGTQKNMYIGFASNYIIPLQNYAWLLNNGSINIGTIQSDGFRSITNNIGGGFSSYIVIYKGSGNTNTLEDLFNNYDIQLVRGRIYQSYEPHLTPGKWYIEKNIKKVILNGTQTASINTDLTNTVRVNYPNQYPECRNTGMLCNRFQYKANWNTDVEGIILDNNNGALWFRINKTRAGTTTTEINNWLANNNVIVYMRLVGPQYIEITNEELINQLNEIQNLQMQQGETNIFWTGEVEPEMKLQYATNEELHDYIITEDGKRIRTDWRSIGRREKWTTK